MRCFQVAGYSGLLLGSPVIVYEIIAFVLPGLTRSERRFLGPIVLGSSVLFYAGLAFSYNVLVPAALNFFVTYAENVVESIWSIDQYFEFVLVLLFSTGLAFQVRPRPASALGSVSRMAAALAPLGQFWKQGYSLKGLLCSGRLAQGGPLCFFMRWRVVASPPLSSLARHCHHLQKPARMIACRHISPGLVVCSVECTDRQDRVSSEVPTYEKGVRRLSDRSH